MERRTIGLSMLFVHAHGLEGGGAGDHFVAEGGLVVGLVVPVDLVVGILPVVCVLCLAGLTGRRGAEKGFFLGRRVRMVGTALPMPNMIAVGRVEVIWYVEEESVKKCVSVVLCWKRFVDGDLEIGWTKGGAFIKLAWCAPLNYTESRGLYLIDRTRALGKGFEHLMMAWHIQWMGTSCRG